MLALQYEPPKLYVFGFLIAHLIMVSVGHLKE